MTYLGLMYQDLINTGEVAAGERLPPVLPMAVYRGEPGWTPLLGVKELVEPPPPGSTGPLLCWEDDFTISVLDRGEFRRGFEVGHIN